MPGGESDAAGMTKTVAIVSAGVPDSTGRLQMPSVSEVVISRTIGKRSARLNELRLGELAEQLSLRAKVDRRRV
jgi:hypothetical protein